MNEPRFYLIDSTIYEKLCISLFSYVKIKTAHTHTLRVPYIFIILRTNFFIHFNKKQRRLKCELSYWNFERHNTETHADYLKGLHAVDVSGFMRLISLLYRRNMFSLDSLRAISFIMLHCKAGQITGSNVIQLQITNYVISITLITNYMQLLILFSN